MRSTYAGLAAVVSGAVLGIAIYNSGGNSTRNEAIQAAPPDRRIELSNGTRLLPEQISALADLSHVLDAETFKNVKAQMGVDTRVTLDYARRHDGDHELFDGRRAVVSHEGRLVETHGLHGVISTSARYDDTFTPEVHARLRAERSFSRMTQEDWENPNWIPVYLAAENQKTYGMDKNGNVVELTRNEESDLLAGKRKKVER